MMNKSKPATTGSGKGSWIRPYDRKKWDKNWPKIFSKKKKREKKNGR